ncbi:hypothetical protein LINGRAHAP2_LOCUS13070, partial [Linum grandiflorum]
MSSRSSSEELNWLLLSSCSRINCNGGESNSSLLFSMMLRVCERLYSVTATKGLSAVTMVAAAGEEGLLRSLDRRMGWLVWRVWRAVWRAAEFGDLVVRNARTAVPVPPGTALDQLCSVPPSTLPPFAGSIF